MFFCIKYELSFDFGWILEKKRVEIRNSGQFRGSFAAAKGPHVAAKGSHAATWLRMKNGPASGLSG